MKKLLSIVLMLVLSVTFLTGCSDPVYDDLENFLNVEMKKINENYDEITAEVGNWENLADDVAIEKSINDKLLPLVNASLEELKDIKPETEEVKEIKAKYVKVMETYKKGFEGLAQGCETQDEEIVNAAYADLEEAVKFLDEYNNALEKLAKEHGSKIEY